MSTAGRFDLRVTLLVLTALLGALPWTGATGTALAIPSRGPALAHYHFGATAPLRACYEAASFPVDLLGDVVPRQVGVYYEGEGVLRVRAVWVSGMWALSCVGLSLWLVRRAWRGWARPERATALLAWSILLVPLDAQLFPLLPWGVPDWGFAGSAVLGRFTVLWAVTERACRRAEQADSLSGPRGPAPP